MNNITIETGDAHGGWGGHAPYDAILLTGSVPVLPPEFMTQLRIGGRLLAVVGEPPIMTAILYTCVAEGVLNEVGLLRLASRRCESRAARSLRILDACRRGPRS